MMRARPASVLAKRIRSISAYRRGTGRDRGRIRRRMHDYTARINVVPIVAENGLRPGRVVNGVVYRRGSRRLGLPKCD